MTQAQGGRGGGREKWVDWQKHPIPPSGKTFRAFRCGACAVDLQSLYLSRIKDAADVATAMDIHRYASQPCRETRIQGMLVSE